MIPINSNKLTTIIVLTYSRFQSYMQLKQLNEIVKTLQISNSLRIKNHPPRSKLKDPINGLCDWISDGLNPKFRSSLLLFRIEPNLTAQNATA